MSVFVDTSALFAVLDADDPNHRRATQMLAALLGTEQLVTHNYVHVEAEQLVRRRIGAGAARRLIEEILPAMQTVWVDATIHESGVRGLAGRGRRASLVDQVSFVVMRHLEIETAFTFDSDFDRAGFRYPTLPDARRHSISEARAPYGGPGETGDLVSVTEMATRSGRSINTIQSWRRRHADFPPPSVELAAGPIWLWSDISAWIGRRRPQTSTSSR